MKKTIATAIIVIVTAGTVFFFFLAKNILRKNNLSIPAAGVNKSVQNPSSIPTDAQEQSVTAAQNTPSDQNTSLFQSPLDCTAQRVTKKPFGIFITPQNSPVQPERFHGWHTGTDFEIFPEELDADVPVHAICSGTIALKEYASGYGGVLVENCELENQPITVIYGHLKLASIMKNTGDNLNNGETIGILGRAFSFETDGERKHLHFGIHKGKSVNVLGYVQSQSELSEWIDPCSLVCK